MDEAVLRRVLGDPLGYGVGLVGIQPYEPARLVVPAHGVVAREQAFYLPGLEDEGVELALGLLYAHLGHLLDETPDLATPVPPVEVGPDAGLQILGLTDVERGAVLVDEIVDAGRVRNALGEVLLLRLDAAPSPADGDRLPDTVYAGGAQEFQEVLEHLRRRRGVGEGPVVRRLAHAEVGNQRAEAVAPEPGHQAAGQLQGVEHLVRELDPAPRGRDEGAVELNVVPDQDAPLDEPLEARHHLGDGWRVRDHAICYAGQAHDEGVYGPSPG